MTQVSARVVVPPQNCQVKLQLEAGRQDFVVLECDGSDAHGVEAWHQVNLCTSALQCIVYWRPVAVGQATPPFPPPPDATRPAAQAGLKP
jgi:hypothetical protein